MNTSQASAQLRSEVSVGQSFPNGSDAVSHPSDHNTDSVVSLTASVAQMTLSEKNLSLAPSPFESFDSFLLPHILSYFQPNDYFSVSHQFCSYALAQFRERNKQVAQALLQRTWIKRLLTTFGVICPEVLENGEATAFLISVKKTVEKINQIFPKELKFTCKTSELLSKNVALESFLRTAYNYNLRQVFEWYACVPESKTVGQAAQMIHAWIETPEARRISTLSLRHRHLFCIPDEVFKFTEISELDLSENNISYLPPDIAKLKNLRTLFLWGNEISELPSEIGSLPLTDFRIYNNKLTRLPPEIGGLKQLRVLDLGHNRLKELPRQIGQLVNLNGLEILGNNIVNLPSTFASLKGLVRLQIDENLVQYVPIEMLKRVTDICYYSSPDWVYLAFSTGNV